MFGTLNERTGPIESSQRKETRPDPVAIVGMGCRLPGAHGLDEFWQVLRSGHDTVTQFPEDRGFGRFYDPNPGTPGRIVSRAGGILQDLDAFDASFFDISPREAARMDPQQRMLLETVWEAFEDAGQVQDSLAGSRTGVFLSYLSTPYSELLRDAGICDLHSAIGAEGRGTAAGRLSHAFDLRGPSMALDATCASSLLAVHLACQSIRAGESTLAVAGGVNVILTPDLSIALSQAGVLSPHGRCRFGDAAADGYVRSEGVVVIIMKSLAQAVADGDQIYALIRGSGVVNDGSAGGSAITPSREGQIDMLRDAYRNAGVAPGDIDYVEAHGTGTALGDRTELSALTQVMGEGRAPGAPCLLGSAKSNVGHTEGAAGLVGLVKVALSMRHRVVPATLHVAEPNPAVDWNNGPLALATTVRPWPDRGRPGLAGVSAFGLSGTNVHVVLEEADRDPAKPAGHVDADDPDDRGGPPVLLLPLSSRTASALPDLARSYLRHLESGLGSDLGSDSAVPHSDREGRRKFDHVLPIPTPAAQISESLADLCWNAGARRTHHEYRVAVVGRSRAELSEQLRAIRDGHVVGAPLAAGAGERRPKIVFVFPGQGSQWAGMGRGLLESSQTFRAAIEECDTAVRAETGWSVIEQLQSAEPLATIDVIQPVLWAVEVALATVWRELGIEPDVVIGHSMGEVAAAVIAGTLSLADAAAVICRRSRILRTVSGQGAMAALQISADEVREALDGYEDRVHLAVVNTDSSVVISGDPEAIEKVISPLRARGVLCQMIRVDIASHSPQMAPLRSDLLAALGAIAPSTGDIPLRSTVTGKRMHSSELDARYWVDNLAEPVQFCDAVRSELAETPTVFIEMGPHPMLAIAVGHILAADGLPGTAVAALRRDTPDMTALLESVGTLYTAGCEPDWTALRGRRGQFVSLPAYPWQRRRYWVDDAVRSASPIAEFRRDGHDANAGDVQHLRFRPADAASRPAAALSPVPAHAEQQQFPGSHRVALKAVMPHDAVGSLPALQQYLVEQIATILGLPTQDVDARRPLPSMGFDSLLVAELDVRLRQDLGVRAPIVEILRGRPLEQLGEDLYDLLGSTRPVLAVAAGATEHRLHRPGLDPAPAGASRRRAVPTGTESGMSASSASVTNVTAA